MIFFYSNSIIRHFHPRLLLRVNLFFKIICPFCPKFFSLIPLKTCKKRHIFDRCYCVKSSVFHGTKSHPICFSCTELLFIIIIDNSHALPCNLVDQKAYNKCFIQGWKYIMFSGTNRACNFTLLLQHARTFSIRIFGNGMVGLRCVFAHLMYATTFGKKFGSWHYVLI
jgi:hypothetical protein